MVFFRIPPIKSVFFLAAMALLLSLAFSQSVQASDSAAGNASAAITPLFSGNGSSGISAPAPTSGTSKASVYFGGKGEGIAQYAMANSSNKTEPSFSYKSPYDPEATVSIGYGKEGAYLKVGYDGSAPVSSSQISKVVSSELNSLSSRGAIQGISASEITEISDLVSKGSGYVVYSGPQEIEEIPPLLPEGLSHLPLLEQGAGESGTDGGEVAGGLPAQPPDAGETLAAAPDDSEYLETQMAKPRLALAFSEILKEIEENSGSVFYHMKEGSGWVGIESGSGGNAEKTGSEIPADAQARGVQKETASQPLSFTLAGLFSAIAIGIVLFGAFVLFAYQLFFRPPAIDYEVYKALSNETRISILQEICEVEKIPTDISRKLEKSKATISEHLDRLLDAGLVERVEQAGKKFVFYRITQKGKSALRQKAA